MSLPLDSTDKKIVLFSVLSLALLTILALLFSPGRRSSSPGYPSSYSNGPDGAKAAYTLLAEMGYRVERWSSPPEDLPKPSKNTVLIVAGPIVPSSNNERRQLKQFVEGGGHLLITGMNGAPMIEAKGVEEMPPLQDAWETFAAETPSPLTLHAPQIAMEAPALWPHLEPGWQRYYGTRRGAAVAKLRFGAGDVIWWGADSPLTNLGITKASNLALFLNCVGSAAENRVLWDEYFHGVRPGLWHYLSHTPLPWALLQLLTLSAFVVITWARRSGSVRPLPRVSRLSPLEFIETVGSLYQRKGAAAGAVEIAYSRFRFLLARRLGISSTAPTADLIRSVRERPAWTIPGFPETLEQIDSAVRHQQVREPQALTWVGKLYEYTHWLGLEG